MTNDEEIRANLAGFIASALLCEAVAGTRPRVDQIASMSVEFADAILDEMDRKPREKK